MEIKDQIEGIFAFGEREMSHDFIFFTLGYGIKPKTLGPHGGEIDRILLEDEEDTKEK